MGNNKLRFILSDNLQLIQKEIVNYLSKIDTEWEETIEKNPVGLESRVFSTQVGNIRFDVRNDGVTIVLIDDVDVDGKYELKRVIEDKLKNGKKIESALWKLLNNRFDIHDDHSFYTRIRNKLAEVYQVENVKMDDKKDGNIYPDETYFLGDSTRHDN